MNLTDDQIKYLLNVPKNINTNLLCFEMPVGGDSKQINLISNENKSDLFIIDINSSRKRIKSLKITFNERYKKEIVLLRLDLNGPPHRNPNGDLLSGNHLHIASEGYGDRYAIEVPNCFKNLSSPTGTLIDFLTYCKVINTKKIQINDKLGGC